MTLHELVERERRQVRRREMIAGGLLGAGAAALILAIGAGVLGDARWLALPRIVPFLVWLVVIAAGGALAWRTRERLRRGATRTQVAHAIESEQRLRRGALLGALELEGRGALASRAAAATRGTLPREGVLAPTLRREGHRRAVFAGGPRSRPRSCSYPRRRCSATGCAPCCVPWTRGAVRCSRGP